MTDDLGGYSIGSFLLEQRKGKKRKITGMRKNKEIKKLILGRFYFSYSNNDVLFIMG